MHKRREHPKGRFTFYYVRRSLTPHPRFALVREGDRIIEFRKPELRGRSGLAARWSCPLASLAARHLVRPPKLSRSFVRARYSRVSTAFSLIDNMAAVSA